MGASTFRSLLQPGQRVRVSLGGYQIGAGVVDDMSRDGSIIWVLFDGTFFRKMFLESDAEVIRSLDRADGAEG